MIEITKDMKAEDIYEYVDDMIESMTKGEIDTVCEVILEAPGDRAWIIYRAKCDGWWNQNDEDTCKAILDAPGNRASAIYLAKTVGWWNQSDEATCRTIFEASGDREKAINLAKRAGWWIEPKDQPIVQ